MQVVTERNRQHASLRFGPNWTEQLLVHELLHLVFDPIREEHDFQLTALQTDRSTEYRARLDREVEKAVEHLSHVLVS